MKLDIKVGTKAKAVASGDHGFADGVEIEFAGYGLSDEDEGYYEYIFMGEVGEFGVIKQYLEAHEFILVEE
ncbi:hypothetical protein [Bacillus phage vB_BanS-Thrax3]|nr:hypothetical protein [Bacillus phage vB_BanS-Thrax3]